MFIVRIVRARLLTLEHLEATLNISRVACSGLSWRSVGRVTTSETSGFVTSWLRELVTRTSGGGGDIICAASNQEQRLTSAAGALSLTDLNTVCCSSESTPSSDYSTTHLPLAPLHSFGVSLGLGVRSEIFQECRTRITL